MKILYSNGDSWTFGCEFQVNSPMDEVRRHYTVWPQKLAEILEIPLVVNEAVSAGNNHRIFRKTCNFILNWVGKNKPSKDLLIVLGWTTPERTEIAVNGKYCRITSNGVIDRITKKLNIYQLLYYDFYDDLEGMSTQIRYMQTLRCICQGLGIRYYDFICLGNAPDEYNRLSLENIGMPLENFYVKTTWMNHVYLNKLSVHKNGHPTVETHDQWANTLSRELL
jgi:hypothetical protein